MWRLSGSHLLRTRHILPRVKNRTSICRLTYGTIVAKVLINYRYNELENMIPRRKLSLAFSNFFSRLTSPTASAAALN
jgi:hypothetical protein